MLSLPLNNSIYNFSCGEVLEGTNETFQSPGGGGLLNSTDGMDCVWVIKVPPGYSVELVFTNVELETR